MTPASIDFDVFKGAQWQNTFTFKQSGTNTPVNLTGLGPFVFTVKKARKDETLFSAQITSNYDNTGVMTITLSAAQTDILIAGSEYSYGLRDAQNNPYMFGLLHAKYFAPEPS